MNDPRTQPETTMRRPPVDLFEFDDHYELRADAPGADTDALELRLENGMLDVQLPGVEQQHTLDHQEFTAGGWSFRYRFGDLVDPAKVQATYVAGVLTITLPKAPALQRRRIDVRCN